MATILDTKVLNVFVSDSYVDEDDFVHEIALASDVPTTYDISTVFPEATRTVVLTGSNLEVEQTQQQVTVQPLVEVSTIDSQIEKVQKIIESLQVSRKQYENFLQSIQLQIDSVELEIASGTSSNPYIQNQRGALLQNREAAIYTIKEIDTQIQKNNQKLQELLAIKEKSSSNTVVLEPEIEILPPITEQNSSIPEGTGVDSSQLNTLRIAFSNLTVAINNYRQQLEALVARQNEYFSLAQTLKALELTPRINNLNSIITSLELQRKSIQAQIEALEEAALPLNNGITDNTNSIVPQEDTSLIEKSGQIDFVSFAGITVPANSPEKELLQRAAEAEEPEITPVPALTDVLRDEVDEEDQPDFIVQEPLAIDGRPTRIFEMPSDPNAEIQDADFKLKDSEKPKIDTVLTEDIQNGYPKRVVLFIRSLFSIKYIRETYFIYRKNMLMDDDYVLLASIPAVSAKTGYETLRRAYGDVRANKYWELKGQLLDFGRVFVFSDEGLRSNISYSYRIACSYKTTKVPRVAVGSDLGVGGSLDERILGVPGGRLAIEPISDISSLQWPTDENNPEAETSFVVAESPTITRTATTTISSNLGAATQTSTATTTTTTKSVTLGTPTQT